MRYIRYLTCTVVLILGCLMTAAAQNAIQTENAMTGTTDWNILIPTPTPTPGPTPGPTPIIAAVNHEIEGYASQTSVNIGETIYFHLNVANSSSTVSFKIYRLGYYDGDGAREWYSATGISVSPQSFPVPDSNTGLAECSWPSPTGANWTVPSSPTPAVSGVYLVKLMNAGFSSYISFVVRDDARTSDVLFQRSVTTDQAYNTYPGAFFLDREGKPTEDPSNGKSLYEANTGGTVLPGGPPTHQARKVSFNRPYGILNNSANGRGIYETAGGTLFSYDYQMIRWLESNGYDVTYCTNVDTHTASDDSSGRLSAGRHKAFLSVGHDEYWSWDMRDNIEQARNRTSEPLNLGFFGGNAVYWQIRFEDSSSSSLPPSAVNRTIVAYKEHADDIIRTAADPFFSDSLDGSDHLITDGNNHLITNLWRDNVANIGTISKPPEDELIGIMSTYYDPYPTLCCGSDTAIIAATSPAWITHNTTGLDPLDNLIGYEVDKYQNSYPGRSLSIVADSPFVDVSAIPTPTPVGNANMTFYNLHSSGAHVFATGSMQWTWGLDDFNADSAVGPVIRDAYMNTDAQTITSNVMDCLINADTQCANDPTDLAVWRPGTNAQWYVMAPDHTVLASESWGTTGDIPAPGDYDGDGKTDFCVFRPSDSTWYIIYSSNSGTAYIPFGTSGDLIASADYDGDGKTDPAVFRPSTGYWYILQSSTSGYVGFPFGGSGDVPASADYDGDGTADATVWRNSDHTFYTLRSSDSGTQSSSFGASGYKPIPCDYDGDGNANYALFQSASSSYFHIMPSPTSTPDSTQFGTIHDQPVPNDYDVDGKCDIAVWRFENFPGNTDNGNWYILNSGSGNSLRLDHWGAAGDTPVPAYYRR